MTVKNPISSCERTDNNICLIASDVKGDLSLTARHTGLRLYGCDNAVRCWSGHCPDSRWKSCL